MNLSVELQIKPQSMTRRMRSLLSAVDGQTNVIPEHLAEPATVSAYANLYTGVSVDPQAPAANATHTNLRAETVLNINGFVLENQHTYRSGNKSTWVRDYTRLVIDDAENEHRYQIGDITVQSRNFQNGLTLGGVQLLQDLIWTDSQTSRPQGNYTFTLDSDAEIKVYQDGILTQTTRLAAGEHKLSELNATQGNQIELHITDTFGKTSTRTFTHFSDSRLLAPDISRYALSVGVPARRGMDAIQYDTKHPVASGYYQQGIDENLTVGIDAQTDGTTHQVGADAIWATPVGNISAGISQSHGKNQQGQAMRLQINSRPPSVIPQKNQTIQLPSWSIAAEQYSQGFQRVTGSPQETAIPPAKRQLNAGISQTLGKHLGASVSASKTEYFNAPATHSTTIGLNANIGKYFNMSVNAMKGNNSFGKEDKSMNISFSIPLESTKSGRYQSLSGSYYDRDGSTRLDYRLGGVVGGHGRDALSSAVNLQSKAGKTALGADMSFQDEQFELNASLSPSINPPKTDYHLQANVNTAVVFADGALALSKPIQDSFALLEAPADLEYPMAAKQGQTVFERDDDDLHQPPKRYDALMQPDGNAVLGNISAYQVQHISTDSAVLPDTYDLNETEFDLMPDYKSGYRLKVGGKPGSKLVLTLLDKQGTAFALQGGQLVNESTKKNASIKFFTDQQGVAEISPLQAGRYRIELFSKPEAKQLAIQVQGEPGTTQTQELYVP
jgi:outer membrane usher protein